MDTRKLRLIPRTTAIVADGGPLNSPIVAEAKHASRTSSRHIARETAAELVHRWNDHLALTKQRDDLLARLKDVIEYAANEADQLSDLEDDGDEEVRGGAEAAQDAVAKARTLIASIEGK